MRLLFKQRFFSWFDSFDIYDEAGDTVFSVEGRMAWGHKLEIMNAAGAHIGTVREEVLTFLPRFALYIGDECVGQIKKEFTLFKPRFTLNCNGWQGGGLARVGLPGDRSRREPCDGGAEGAAAVDGHLYH